MKMKNKECCNEKSQFVAIGASMMGILMVIFILFLIFAREQLALMIPITWAFVALGGLLGFFQFMADRKKK